MEPDPNSPDVRNCCNKAAVWKFPLLLAVVLLGIFLWKQNEKGIQQTGPTASASTWSPSATPQGETVALEIDFGNGAKRVFDALPSKPDMTVADVMQAATQFAPHITYSQLGEGAGGFLTELEGVKNEGANGRNWQYEVAGTPGTMSFCLARVTAGERVRWTFAGKDENR